MKEELEKAAAVIKSGGVIFPCKIKKTAFVFVTTIICFKHLNIETKDELNSNYV